jgi:hypothetical protein
LKQVRESDPHPPACAKVIEHVKLIPLSLSTNDGVVTVVKASAAC